MLLLFYFSPVLNYTKVSISFNFTHRHMTASVHMTTYYLFEYLFQERSEIAVRVLLSATRAA